MPSTVEVKTLHVLAIITGKLNAPGVSLEDIDETVQLILYPGYVNSLHPFEALHEAANTLFNRLPFLKNIETRRKMSNVDWQLWSQSLVKHFGDTLCVPDTAGNEAVKYDRNLPFLRINPVPGSNRHPRLVVLTGFTCNREFSVLPVLTSSDQRPYVQCDHGRHYLDGQETESTAGNFYMGVWEYRPDIPIPVVEYEEIDREIVCIDKKPVSPGF